jgi:O-antigen ligase
MAIADRNITRRVLMIARSAYSIVRPHATVVIEWAANSAPIVGRSARARRNRTVLPPYRELYSLKGEVTKIFAALALAVMCLMYGFFFGLTAPSLIVAFIAPIFVLSALIIWALPHQRAAPTLGIEFLYAAFFVALVAWPNYVAISLPGLPWITMLRIVGLPMVMLLLLSLSVSPEFQQRASESVNGIKLSWIFMRAFILVQIITLIFSKSIGASAQLVFNDQVYFTAVFVIGSVIFRKISNIERYWFLLCVLSVPIMIVLKIESSEQHLPWMKTIPSFLQINDATVQRILVPSYRAGTNFFRAKATFSTQLETAEYLGLLTPFLLYFGFYKERHLAKILSFSMIPAIFISIRLTDSRLGLVAMLVSFLLYGMLWSIVRWRSRPGDLMAAAVVYAYPAIFIGGVGLVMVSHTLHDMVFGGGAQASSNEARSTQLQMAMKGFMAAPWGHGAGQDGDAMGYAKISQITVDNYFIALLLDYGALGIIFWYGMFIVAIVEAVRCSISSRYAGTREAALLAPLAVALSAFLVVKWVHAGDYNHPIAYMMLGMVSALIYNLRKRILAVPEPVIGRAALAAR